jgi:uncharacterized protein YigE (DUF2233 family)
LKSKKSILYVTVLVLLATGLLAFAKWEKAEDERFVTYVVDLNQQDLKFYWKDEKEQPIRSLLSLKNLLEQKKQKLAFAMNGGMYKPDNSPQGLFIQEQAVLAPLDTNSGSGNFYLKPNGVFYISRSNIPVVCRTTDFANNGEIKYATQSGPMLIIDGQIHPAFKQGSINLNIRNGVGIMPDNKVIFAMSKKEINFYDFADYFKKMGCRNALYLDGFVSRTYLPEKDWIQTDGNFGVIIAVAENQE